MNKNVSIAVIGAGAIGGTTAAFIAKAGYSVYLVCKYDEIKKNAMNGLKVVGVKGDHVIRINAVQNIEELPTTTISSRLVTPKDSDK